MRSISVADLGLSWQRASIVAQQVAADSQWPEAMCLYRTHQAGAAGRTAVLEVLDDGRLEAAASAADHAFVLSGFRLQVGTGLTAASGVAKSNKLALNGWGAQTLSLLAWFETLSYCIAFTCGLGETGT